jgi:murein DD-endopeptidase
MAVRRKFTKIKWNALSEHEKQKFEKMNEVERFIFFLLKQFGSPYGWGNETPEKADCSGAVCMALYAATGLLIRITADGLYNRVFTAENPRANQIRAVFYLAKKNQKHGSNIVPAGTATHVAGILDDGIILNSQEPYAKVRRINELSDWYQRNGHEVAIRGLNREALERLAKEGKAVHDLDTEFWKYFER